MENISYVAVQGIEITDFGEERIIFNPNKDSVHLLNRTSAEILEMLSEPKTIVNIIEMFHEKYGDITGLDEDVMEMLHAFTESGVVETIAAS